LPHQDGTSVAVPRDYYLNASTTEVERIEPLYNRMVWYNASHWHRVAPVTRGARFSLLVNLWKERPILADRTRTTSSAVDDTSSSTMDDSCSSGMDDTNGNCATTEPTTTTTNEEEVKEQDLPNGHEAEKDTT